MNPLPQRAVYRDRNISTISKDLAKTTSSRGNLSSSSHFLNCRYDPFNPAPVKSYIPDGRGANILVRDIKIAHDIVVASGEIMNISVFPWLPFPVGFSTNDYMTLATGSNSTIDGYKLGGVSSGGPGAVISQYLRAVFPNQLRSTYLNIVANPGEAGNVLGSRVTTIGYRLFYTGKASDAQGVMSAIDVAWSIDSSVSANTNALSQYVALSPVAVASNDAAPANTSPLTVVGIPANNTNLLATNQVMVRPENGLRGILKYQKPPDAHVFQPWFENGTMVGIPGISTNTELLITTRSQSAYSTGQVCEYNMLDPSLMGALLKITGSGSYRLEVAICYEQDISLGNYMIDMARPSPMIDRVLLDVDATLNSTVHAAPLNGAIVELTSAIKSMKVGRPTKGNSKRGKPRRVRRRARKTNTTACKTKGGKGKK